MRQNNSEIKNSGVTALVAGAATITLALEEGYSSWFVAVEFYNAVTGLAADVVLPTSGTAVFTHTSPVLPTTYQTGDTLNYAADENVPIAYDTPLKSVKCVLAAIAGNGATHCRVRAIGYVS